MALWRSGARRRSPSFDQHAQRTIAAVIDLMLPSDELPGAVALGIDRRIQAMADVPPRQSLTELKAILAEGVAWLDRRALAAYGRQFLGLDPARREVVLSSVTNSKDEGAAAIGWTLRDRAFALYYTHPVVLAAFAYSGPPQPLGFPDGAIFRSAG
jgi:hypothetical protein